VVSQSSQQTPTAKEANERIQPAEFVKQCRNMDVTPHVAQNDNRPSGIHACTTPHAGYEVGQKKIGFPSDTPRSALGCWPLKASIDRPGGPLTATKYWLIVFRP
jgi:hypothetical protein